MNPSSAAKNCRLPPWTERLAVLYAAWCSRDLLASWLQDPFARWGGLAFLLWLTPLALTPFQRHRIRSDPLSLLLAGLGLVLLGNLGELHAGCHVGLTVILLRFTPDWRSRALLGLTAISWMPAFGWCGSQFGLAPAVVKALRLSLALAGAAAALFLAWLPSARKDC